MWIGFTDFTGIKRILFFLLVSACTTAFSQETFNGGISFGMATSKIQGDGNGGYHKGGIALSAFGSKELSDKWKAKLSIGFIQKGSVRPGTEQNGGVEYIRIALDYVEVPLTFYYDYKKMYGIMGLAAGSLIRHVEEDFAGIRANRLNTKNLDFFLILGGGIDLGTKVRLGVTYQNSIIPIADAIVFNPNRILGGFGGAFNQVVLLQLDFSFFGR